MSGCGHDRVTCLTGSGFLIKGTSYIFPFFLAPLPALAPPILCVTPAISSTWRCVAASENQNGVSSVSHRLFHSYGTGLSYVLWSCEGPTAEACTFCRLASILLGVTLYPALPPHGQALVCNAQRKNHQNSLAQVLEVLCRPAASCHRSAYGDAGVWSVVPPIVPSHSEPPHPPNWDNRHNMDFDYQPPGADTSEFQSVVQMAMPGSHWRVFRISDVSRDLRPGPQQNTSSAELFFLRHLRSCAQAALGSHKAGSNSPGFGSSPSSSSFLCKLSGAGVDMLLGSLALVFNACMAIVLLLMVSMQLFRWCSIFAVFLARAVTLKLLWSQAPSHSTSWLLCHALCCVLGASRPCRTLTFRAVGVLAFHGILLELLLSIAARLK